jgi:hypothetical protein
MDSAIPPRPEGHSFLAKTAVRRIVVVALAAVLAGGCAVPVQLDTGRAPNCATAGATGSAPLVLMAQAVPTAALLPCIALLPTGWRYAGALDIRSGRASFLLGSDRAGRQAVRVLLTERCDVGRATQVPTDELGTSRFELVRDVSGGYRGTRFYRFDGGCVAYEFRLEDQARAVPVSEASLALGFVRRTQLDIQVRERTGLRLNPPQGG